MTAEEVIKLQKQSEVPLNLNIEMQLNEKDLAAAISKRIDTILSVQQQKPPELVLSEIKEKPSKLYEERKRVSSIQPKSKSGSVAEEEEKGNFVYVQRNKGDRPLTLKPEQVHRTHSPDALHERRTSAVVVTKKQIQYK